MIMLLKKSWVFPFLIVFLLLLAVFYSSENFIKAKFFGASLLEAPVAEQLESRLGGTENLSESSVEAGPLFALAEESIARQLTKEEIQEELDDIAEKLDIVQQQVDELVAQAKANEPQKLEEDKEEKDDEEIIKEDKTEEQSKLPEKPPKNVSAGGGAKPIYLKILISEIQISPIEQRFVELYNPNEAVIDLTGWYLQRKTATSAEYSSFVTKNDFAEKIILANGYFLISRGLPNSDILIDDLTITENNSFTLKNPNREISDEMSFNIVGENKSIGRKLDVGDFELCTPTPKAQNITYVAPPPPEETDTTPPTVDFTLDPVQNSLNFAVNFLITDPFETVTPSGIGSYIFRWKEETGDWQEDPQQEIVGAPTSHNAERESEGENGKTYYFQIKAFDVAGNISSWLPDIPVLTTVSASDARAIVINEIQTEGQTVKDEFIELYNPNNFDVDLSDFSLKKKTSGGNESNLVSSSSFTGIISALGFFLIVPQNNDDGTPNYTGSVIPDLYYSGKSYSIASNNTVLLYDKNDSLQDKVGFGEAEDFEVAPAQNSGAGKSITRTGGTDTNDNSVDFTISDTPTPKSE